MQCIYDMFEGLGKRPSGDPKERAGQIFRKIDINGDGDLTENEFIKGCSDDKVKRQDIKLSLQEIYHQEIYPQEIYPQEMMELLNSLFASITGGS